ncbi:AmmeMemoRadiSam system protein B [Desulfatirhabdium butyrativorans]|uniref:AmmeMemoRadiSam system protein B n=1 Tax=Desulfatirhabdium butyrativorans TaxID=340467 RepID=UPI000484757E|nr:AmmeMemoRadiSam system protein B [Desulfatirhabdium butyrativorans]
MRRFVFWMMVVAVLFWQGVAESGVRQAAYAGKFYPAQPRKLAQAIDDLLADAIDSNLPKPVAIVVPHAGWVYSGNILADAFRLVSRYSYDVVVLLGTNHTAHSLKGAAVFDAGAYRTPLGDAAVDESIAKALIGLGKPMIAAPADHQDEHSIEVVLPFVQKCFPSASVVPVIVGGSNAATWEKAGAMLARILKGKNALIVASSDLSHYPDADTARKVDLQTLSAICSMNPAAAEEQIHGIERANRGLSTAACGLMPILTAMKAANDLGAMHASIISYANSGDTLLGDRKRVVGYGAVAMTVEDVPAAAAPEAKVPVAGAFTEELTAEQKETLLRFARKSLQMYLGSETLPLFRDPDPVFYSHCGAFVTLKKQGNLRGCIGHLEADTKMYRIVGKMAISAATQDPRFSPLDIRDLQDVHIEISLLTPYRPVASFNDIVVGKHGVLLKKFGQYAVFLPQVATEQGWDRSQMLDHLCRKAGFDESCWKKNASFEVFEAMVFEEP